MKKNLLFAITLITTLTLSTLMFVTKAASDPIVVTPTNQQGWMLGPSTASGGAVNFVVDSTAPAGGGALQLTTNLTIASKAHYVHDTNTLLADVTDLSYYTKQVSGPPIADPAYQLAVCLNGVSSGCVGFSTLVFEPYSNPQQQAIVPNVWQQWDVDAGLFYSTRTVTCSNGIIVGGSGGPAIHTLDSIKAACPNAVVFQYIVNVGSNNPGYNVYTDLFNFNGTIYDFEPDSDGDGIPNGDDNCPFVSNPGQENADGDAEGDVCDPDDDNDGVLDGSDECPGTPTGTQVNADGCPDADGDGITDTDDNCPTTSNPGQADTDGDGIGNACDPCPTTVGCPVATTKDQCKNGGWMTFKRADGSSFRNQGDCVSYVSNGK